MPPLVYECASGMANVSEIIREEEGSRLKAAYQRAKLKRRLTQSVVATECGWKNASTFNRILTGKIPLTVDSLNKLSLVLNFTPSSVSPRLTLALNSQDARISRLLPVSLVKAVTRGSWGEPFITERSLPFFTKDDTAFALIFDPGIAPSGLSGWVAVVEPAGSVVSGDRVVVRHGVGKYSYGEVGAGSGDGVFPVIIESRGTVMTTPKRCMLVAGLAPFSALQ